MVKKPVPLLSLPGNGEVSSLLELSCVVVSECLTWGELECGCGGGGVIPLPVVERYVFHAFPRDTEEMKYMWDEGGEFEVGGWEVRGVVQVGMTLVGGVRRRKIVGVGAMGDEDDDGEWVDVKVNFERCRLVGVVCGCGRQQFPFYCGHVIALCLFRGRNGSVVEVRAPISETLGRLSRGQLQGVLQGVMLHEWNAAGVGGVDLLRSVQDVAEEVLLRGGGVSGGVGGAPDVSICWGDEATVDPLVGVAEMLREEFAKSGGGWCVSGSKSRVPFLLGKVKLLLGGGVTTTMSKRLVGVVRDEVAGGRFLRPCCVRGACPVGEELRDLVAALLEDAPFGNDAVEGLARGVWLGEMMKNGSVVEKAVGVVESVRNGGGGLGLRWGARVGGVLLRGGHVGAALELAGGCFTKKDLEEEAFAEGMIRGEDLLVGGVVRVGLEEELNGDEFLERMKVGVVRFPYFELGRLLLEFFGGRALNLAISLFRVGGVPDDGDVALLSVRGVRLLEDVVTVMIRDEAFELVDELVAAVDGCGLLSVVGVVGVCRRVVVSSIRGRRSVLVPLGVWLLGKTLRNSGVSCVRLRMEVVMMMVGMSEDDVWEELLERWEEVFTEEEVVGVVAARVTAQQQSRGRILGKVRDVAMEVLRRGQCPSVLLGALGVVLMTTENNNNRNEAALHILREKRLSAGAAREVRGYLLARGISLETSNSVKISMETI